VDLEIKIMENNSIMTNVGVGEFSPTSSLSQKEEKAIIDGSLFFVDSVGFPSKGLSCIWFVWYRVKDQEDSDYRIVLKSMRSRQESSEHFLNLFKSGYSSERYDSGLGQLVMSSGKMVFFKPEIF
jgi:hypothetical protein